MQPKILVSRAIFPDVIARLAEYFDVEANDGDEVWSEAQFEQRLSDKHGALIFGEPVGAAALARAPLLRVVSNMAVGYNNFDLEAFSRHGVVGTNTPDVVTESTADFAWALMMSAARRVAESDRMVRTGAWQRWSYDLLLGQDLHGKTLGVLGMGRIGQAVARRAAGFSMRVLYHNRSRADQAIETRLNAAWVGKDDLLRMSDHLILVLPLTPESRHTIGARELGLMKPTATLTNIARGGIVDDAALVAALAEGQIAGAGLDVFEGEPRLNSAFLKLDNVVLTPHNAPGSEATRRAMANLAADNLIAALGFGPHAFRPANAVNPEVLDRKPASVAINSWPVPN